LYLVQGNFAKKSIKNYDVYFPGKNELEIDDAKNCSVVIVVVVVVVLW